VRTTRLEPAARVVLTQQRWHTEDLGGKLLATQGAEWRAVSLPALAEQNDPLGRQPGEALWPERYPAAELERRRSHAPTWFAAQYQQRPLDLDGGFFRGLEKVRIVPAAPTDDQFTKVVRWWDLAATEKQAGADPDWAVGLKMGKHRDKTFVVLDVQRVRLGPKGVRQLIRQTAELDGKKVPIRIEREGAASGKIAADAIVTEDLAGWPAYAVAPKGNKAERAEPWGAQVEAGNVAVVKAGWNAALLDEHRAFPTGAHDDIVDAASGAFGELAGGGGWDFSPLARQLGGR